MILDDGFKLVSRWIRIEACTSFLIGMQDQVKIPANDDIFLSSLSISIFIVLQQVSLSL